MCHPECLNTTSFSQGYILKTPPSVGMAGRTYVAKTKQWGRGAPACPGPAHGQPVATPSQWPPSTRLHIGFSEVPFYFIKAIA